MSLEAHYGSIYIFFISGIPLAVFITPTKHLSNTHLGLSLETTVYAVCVNIFPQIFCPSWESLHLGYDIRPEVFVINSFCVLRMLVYTVFPYHLRQSIKLNAYNKECTCCWISHIQPKLYIKMVLQMDHLVSCVIMKNRYTQPAWQVIYFRRDLDNDWKKRASQCFLVWFLFYLMYQGTGLSLI